MGFFSWFWGLFPSNRAECIGCGNTYAKEAMKELWFKYQEHDGTEGTATVYVCQPCMNEIAEDIEDEWCQEPMGGIIELDIDND